MAAGLFGVRLDSGRPELASEAECAIVAAAGRKRTKELLRLARAQSRRVLLEVSTAEEAAMAGDLGFDGVVSKTPLAAPVPVWGAGGIGLHSAAAWYAGGAAGVVLDVEDASWAALAQRFRTLPAIVRGLRDSIREHVELAGKACRLEPLAQRRCPIRASSTAWMTPRSKRCSPTNFAHRIFRHRRRPFRGHGRGAGRPASEKTGGKGRPHRVSWPARTSPIEGARLVAELACHLPARAWRPRRRSSLSMSPSWAWAACFPKRPTCAPSGPIS
jgi:hypothetical protein